jgi:hypothetical protein
MLVILTQAGYWFILRFCQHFNCLSCKIQNAIKLQNISNLIASPSSYPCKKYTLENTEGAITNGQSWKTDNIGYTRPKQKQKHNTICVWHLYMQTNTNNVNKPSYRQLEVKTNRTSFYVENVTDVTTWNSEHKDT